MKNLKSIIAGTLFLVGCAAHKQELPGDVAFHQIIKNEVIITENYMIQKQEQYLFQKQSPVYLEQNL